MRRIWWVGLLVSACNGGTDPGQAGPIDQSDASTQADAGPDTGSTQEIDAGSDANTDAGCTQFGLYYVDADRDGFGTGSQVSVCEPAGAGYATVAGDCDDSDEKVFPGQTKAQPGAKDYNCVDGPVPSPSTTTFGPCNASGAGCNSGAGSTENFWLGSSAPACGQPGTWVIRCAHIGGGQCEPQTEQRVQRCL